MKNSIAMLSFCVFDLKYTFFWKLIPKTKTVCLSWNLESRLIWICRIRWYFTFFLIRKYPFRVNLIQKFKTIIIRQNLLPTLECLIDLPPLINLSIFSLVLINYWEKFSTRVWNDILILSFSQSRKRSDPSGTCFALQVRAKKPTQCFVL